MNKKKIDYRFKILYAVAILMVVAGHCDGGGISLDFAQWFPYEGIHLALFTFCSGYFFKDAALKRPGRYVCKKLRTLILPMYGYMIAYGLLVRLLHRWGFQIGGKFNLHNILISPLNDGHQFVLNMAGWYIVPLFMVEILNCMIRAFFKRKGWQIPEWIFFAGAVLIGMGGNFLAIMEYRTSWWLTVVRILYFAPFYYMPKDVEQTKILYLLAAIFVALLIQWILTQVKKMGKNIFLYVRQ